MINEGNGSRGVVLSTGMEHRELSRFSHPRATFSFRNFSLLSYSILFALCQVEAIHLGPDPLGRDPVVDREGDKAAFDFFERNAGVSTSPWTSSFLNHFWYLPPSSSQVSVTLSSFRGRVLRPGIAESSARSSCVYSI